MTTKRQKEILASFDRIVDACGGTPAEVGDISLRERNINPRSLDKLQEEGWIEVDFWTGDPTGTFGGDQCASIWVLHDHRDPPDPARPSFTESELMALYDALDDRFCESDPNSPYATALREVSTYLESLEE